MSAALATTEAGHATSGSGTGIASSARMPSASKGRISLASPRETSTPRPSSSARSRSSSSASHPARSCLPSISERSVGTSRNTTGRSAERSATTDADVSSRPMCEHFVARSSEPFRLDELWPFAGRLERFGMAGFGWGASWLTPTEGLAIHRDIRAFRDDPGRDAVGCNETTSVLVHLRRPSKLSTLQLADTQPFLDPAGRFAFSHNGDLQAVRDARKRYAGEGRIHGRADSEVGARWLEDAWAGCSSPGAALRALHETFGG